MKLNLLQQDIKEVSADGLILPCDGNICVIGGTAAAKALKASFANEAEDNEEQIEFYVGIEDDVKRLRPLPHGTARIIDGNETWPWLVVIAVLPHHVNDVIFTPAQFSTILKTGIANGINGSLNRELKSVALTLIGTTYRITADQSIKAIAEGLSAARRGNIEVNWCILDNRHFELAKRTCRYLNLIAS